MFPGCGSEKMSHLYYDPCGERITEIRKIVNSLGYFKENTVIKKFEITLL